MFAAVPTMVAVLAVSLVLGLILARVIAPLSQWRNGLRAKKLGALWSGAAMFDVPLADDQPAMIHATFDGVGGPYLRGVRVPHRGVLIVFSDRLTWRPRSWFGRGQASPWSLPIEEVEGIEAADSPVAGVYPVAIRTSHGTINCTLIDAKRAVDAIEVARRTLRPIKRAHEATDGDWQEWYAEEE